jgi:hypothetical protein
MLNTFQDDPCCNKPLIRALEELEGAFTWICPKCGCEWKAMIHHTVTEVVGDQAICDSIKHWTPVPMIEMLRV